MTDNNREHLSFVVGEERRFEDIVKLTEILPMLEGAVKAGASLVTIKDEHGQILWSYGDQDGKLCEAHKIIVEGEPVATLELHADTGTDIKGIATLLNHSINTLIKTNLKRMLTSEIHTTIVHHSYEELLKINADLAVSEKKYRDLSETLEEQVKERTEELRQTHARMLQQEKMASIGALAAGIAHEINNPMGFIASNLRTLSTYFANAQEMLMLYRKAPCINQDSPEAYAEAWKKLKLDFILDDANNLINESLEGAGRITLIVRNLRAVSHIDDSESGIMDINAEIDGLVSLLSHETPSDTKFIRNYSTIPGFKCRQAMLSQALLNVLLNALQSKDACLEVTLKTSSDPYWIYIEIADNGPGIPDNIKNRIYEPFFTTKEVGKGQGLGLTTAYETICSHGGTIEFFNQNGACFLIKLPIRTSNG